MKKLAPLALFAILSACGSEKSSEDYNPDAWRPLPESEEPDTPLEKRASEFFAKGGVSCSGANCHDSAAMLLAANLKEQYSTCSGFLIAPDTLVTNSHCVPDDLKEKPSTDCMNRISIHFPRTAELQAEKVNCREVVEASKLYDMSKTGDVGQDYAVIKLAREVKRPVLKVSHEGFADGGKYFIHKMNPGGGPNGTYEKIECEAVQRSLLLPGGDSDAAPLAFLTRCPVRPGNSGSMILSPEGEAVGVLQIQIKSDSLPRVFRDSLKEMGIANVEVASTMHQAAIGTSFACLGLPGSPVGSLAAGCGNLRLAFADETLIAQELKKALEAFDPAKAELAVREVYERWAEKAPEAELFSLDVKTDEAGTVFYAEPACYQAEALLLKLDVSADRHNFVFSVPRVRRGSLARVTEEMRAVPADPKQWPSSNDLMTLGWDTSPKNVAKKAQKREVLATTRSRYPDLDLVLELPACSPESPAHVAETSVN
jgi:hypothetical protein